MTYDEYQPDQPPLLRTIGRYIAFFAGAALCIYFLPALWELTAADDRVSRSAFRVIAVMTGSTILVLIGGILLALGRTWSGGGLCGGNARSLNSLQLNRVVNIPRPS